MNIAILGAGNVGRNLATLFVDAGYQVVLGVRLGSAKPAVQFPCATPLEMAESSPLVVLALPNGACLQVLPELELALIGKVVVDATNPLNDDWSPRLLGEQNSAAEQIARLLPGSQVVKCFNTVFADIMNRTGLNRDGQRVTAFVAGDHAAANRSVEQLADAAGFAALASGPLRNARYLEAMAHLNIDLAVGLGGGTDAAFVYLQA